MNSILNKNYNINVERIELSDANIIFSTPIIRTPNFQPRQTEPFASVLLSDYSKLMIPLLDNVGCKNIWSDIGDLIECDNRNIRPHDTMNVYIFVYQNWYGIAAIPNRTIKEINQYPE